MTLEVPEEVGSILDSYVDPAGRTRGQIIRDAVAEYVSEQQSLMIAVQRRKEFLQGKAETVSLEELMDELGIPRVL